MEPITYTEQESRLAQKTIELGRADKLANELFNSMWDDVVKLPSYTPYAEARDAAMKLRAELTKMEREPSERH